MAITKPELHGQTGVNEGIVRWLLYSLACGLIINSQEGKPFKIISSAAIVSSSALVATIFFKYFLLGGVPVSGIIINFDTKAVFASQLLAGLFCTFYSCYYDG